MARILIELIVILLIIAYFVGLKNAPQCIVTRGFITCVEVVKSRGDK